MKTPALILVLVLLHLHTGYTQASDKTQALDIDDSQHFLQRSGFALPPDLVQTTTQLSRGVLISKTVNNASPVCPIDPPAWTRQALRLRQDYRDMPVVERRKVQTSVRRLEKKRIAELQHWWITNLIYTENPLAAKMVLFWQNHFTSEQRKVRHAQLMYQQHQVFQEHGMGNFRTLLTAILKDPVMLVYLDNRSNRKNSPNENLARELLELFTLGEGHYSESDIKETARALTGYTVTRKMEFKFSHARHDAGSKTILGSTAQYDMDMLIDLLLAQPQTARTIVSKLWKVFISPTPDPREVERLSAVLRDADYEIKPLLRALFESDAFWAFENRNVLIKSPAQFIADTLRVWQLNVLKPKTIIVAMKNMEQRLFNPPNVKGWQGGSDWINTTTLLARDTFLRQVFRSAEDRDDARDNNPGMPAMSGMAEGGDNTPQVRKLLQQPGWHLY